MTQVPIQINKSEKLPNKKATPSDVDLKAALKKKKTARRWWAVFLVLILIIASLAGYIYLFLEEQAELPYVNYLPQETAVFSVIDKDKIYSQLAPAHSVISSQFGFYQWLTTQANDYFNQAGLSFKQDVLPLFTEKIGLAIYPSNEQNSVPFVLFLEKKAASAQINRVLDQLKKELKQNFHLSEELYRQNNVTSLKSIHKTWLNYRYTQVKDLLIISNSQEILEATIDLVIGN